MEKIFYGKNRRLFIVIYLLVLVLWLSFIFYNSAANGAQSAAQSGRVVELIQKFVRLFDSETIVDAVAVRNTAHFVEFFVLGFLYFYGSFFIKASRLTLFLHSLSLSLFTAFIDETIQLFSFGRGAEVKDIWTDFSGAIVAHILVFAIYYSYRHFKNASK